MEFVSVMHCADMHLGKPVSAFDKTKNQNRILEMEQSCLSVIEQAKGCHVALLSGDIFDSSDVPERLCKLVVDKIASMPDVNFFYSCGNHDPYIGKSTDYLVCNCPDNLHIFGYESIEFVTLEQFKTRVYGISFSERYTEESLIEDIGMCDPEYINIMCIHGEIADKSLYNPLNMKVLEKSGFDYVALGHIHNFDGIKKINKMTYAYSGCVEPSGFDECGEKGYIIGNVKKGESNLEFISTCKRKYHSISVDVSDIKDYVSVINEINKKINTGDDLWRVNLCGENNIDSFLNFELIKNNVDAFYLEIQDDTRNSYDIKKVSENFSLLGLCAKETISLSEKETDEEKIKLYNDAFSVLYRLLDKGGER